jgi:hypothetical protein
VSLDLKPIPNPQNPNELTAWDNFKKIKTYADSSFYEEGSFTGTLTGCTTSPTATIKYIKIGKLVQLVIPELRATSNTTACTVTGLPSIIWPTTNQIAPVQDVEDATLFYSGSITVTTGGVIKLYVFRTTATGQTETMTNSGTKGFAGAYSVVTYSMA